MISFGKIKLHYILMETSNVSDNNANERQDNDSCTIIRDFVWLALARIPTQECG